MATSRPAHQTVPWARYRIPASRPDLVPRPRLTAALERAVKEHRVSVVGAPSGHGKTRAAAEWAEHQRRRVAWLSLGPADADPAVLDAGVISALRGLLPAGDDPRQSLPQRDPENDLSTLYQHVCDAFAQPSCDSVLVIDDAQLAGDQLRAGLLGMLLDDAPEHLRLVLVGTTPIEVWMARQILDGSAAQLTAEELAFDCSETEGLLKRFGGGLDSHEVLEDTQGWPIAVQMAALAGQSPTGAGDSLDELLRSYVQTQILSGLEGSLAVFILMTTACPELTADLAAAVSGRDDAAAVLEELADRGIFLHRHCESGETRTYRWHPIFARHCT